MARKIDSSPHPSDWTNAKLMREARRLANMEQFGGYLPEGYTARGFPHDDGDAIREATRLYRESWLDPVLDEIESRFVRNR